MDDMAKHYRVTAEHVDKSPKISYLSSHSPSPSCMSENCIDSEIMYIDENDTIPSSGNGNDAAFIHIISRPEIILNDQNSTDNTHVILPLEMQTQGKRKKSLQYKSPTHIQTSLSDSKANVNPSGNLSNNNFMIFFCINCTIFKFIFFLDFFVCAD